MNLHNGSCFCGEVNYILNSEIMKVVNCHCNFCRSHSGAAFSSYAALPFASLEFTKGKEKLSAFQFGDGKIGDGKNIFAASAARPYST